MVDKINVGTVRKLTFSGFFRAHELYKMLRKYFADEGFDDWVELENFEKQVKGKRQVEIYYMPRRKYSDYARVEVKILLTIQNLIKKEVEFEGKKVKIDSGDISISFEPFLTTDYEDRWSGGPQKSNKTDWFIIRMLMNKFVLKVYTSKYEKLANKLVDEIYNKTKQYLNASKYHV